jgi:hypothetical protein
MTRPHHRSSGKYTNEMVARITLLANRLYLSYRQDSQSKAHVTVLGNSVSGDFILAVRHVCLGGQGHIKGPYESVRNPEAATPQIRRFHELRSSS